MIYEINLAIVSDFEILRVFFDHCSDWHFLNNLKSQLLGSGDLENHRETIEHLMLLNFSNTENFNIIFSNCSKINITAAMQAFLVQ